MSKEIKILVLLQLTIRVQIRQPFRKKTNLFIIQLRDYQQARYIILIQKLEVILQ
jgi:hypothetical protein